jgi:hypothetical protein
MEFKEIINYPNYEISNDGTIRNKINRKMLSLINKNGYLCINLCQNGKVKQHYVHRLVAINFLDNPNNKRVVDHINNNKTNNNITNLRWCDQMQNCFNRKLNLNSSSGIKGVSLDKKTNKYRSYIKNTYLGLFKTKEQAQQYRIKMAHLVFGEYASSSESLLIRDV